MTRTSEHHAKVSKDKHRNNRGTGSLYLRVGIFLLVTRSLRSTPIILEVDSTRPNDCIRVSPIPGLGLQVGLYGVPTFLLDASSGLENCTILSNFLSVEPFHLIGADGVKSGVQLLYYVLLRQPVSSESTIPSVSCQLIF